MKSRLLAVGLLGLASCGAEVLLGVHDGVLPDQDAEAGNAFEASSDANADADADLDANGALDVRDAEAGCDRDVLGSPTSCGACGHSCGGATCTNGLCDRIPIASGLNGPLWVDTDGIEVFWGATAGATANPKPVQKVSVLGGMVTTLLPGGEGRLGGVHADGLFVYAAQEGPGATVLQQLAKADGGATAIGLDLTGVPQPEAVVSDATNVYVAMGPDVRRFAKTGPAVPGTSMGDPFVKAFGLALDGTSLYVTDRTAGTVSVINTTTSIANGLATGQGKLATVTFDATHVYYTGFDRVARVPKAGGMASTIATGFGESLGIVVDGPTVYWAGKTIIYAAPIGGGPARPIGVGYTLAGHLAQDAQFLYIPDFATGEVYKMAKLPK